MSKVYPASGSDLLTRLIAQAKDDELWAAHVQEEGFPRAIVRLMEGGCPSYHIDDQEVTYTAMVDLLDTIATAFDLEMVAD